jgi:uncharacterized OB-fold protein
VNAVLRRPEARISDDTAPYWTGGEHDQLMITHCTECGYYSHPPSPVCSRCLSWAVAPKPVSGRGRVYTFTVNWQQWSDDFLPPYVIAVIELEEQDGLRITTNVQGCHHDDVKIGMPVRVAFEQGQCTWIPIFEPS